MIILRSGLWCLVVRNRMIVVVVIMWAHVLVVVVVGHLDVDISNDQRRCRCGAFLGAAPLHDPQTFELQVSSSQQQSSGYEQEETVYGRNQLSRLRAGGDLAKLWVRRALSPWWALSQDGHGHCHSALQYKSTVKSVNVPTHRGTDAQHDLGAAFWDTRRARVQETCTK